jgi:hypothetical protein
MKKVLICRSQLICLFQRTKTFVIEFILCPQIPTLYQPLRKRNKKVKPFVYVGFSPKISRALVDSCKETQTLTKEQLLPFIQEQKAAS